MSETHFPLDESKLPFSIPKDAQPREKILKLGRMITDRIPAKLHGLTAEDPEYWGLAGVVTDEMADVALKMKVRKPMTVRACKSHGQARRRAGTAAVPDELRGPAGVQLGKRTA